MNPAVKVCASMLALILVAGACGSGEREDGGPPPEPPTTAAATMRIALETLFREHAYLLGLATENAATAQVAPFEAAIEALEENALALGDLFETAYNARGEGAFLTAWRPYTDLVGQYAARKARDLRLGKTDQAFARVGGAVASFAATLTPLINARVIGGKMRDLIASLRGAVDAQVADDFGKGVASLRIAGDRASEIGSLFARAFADDVPGVFGGNPAGPGVDLRSTLSATLTDHVYLLGTVTENILTKQSRPRDGAKATLDAVVATFAKHLGAHYGSEAEKAFLPLWMRGSETVLAYATSIKDPAKVEQVRGDLERYATDLARFLEGLNRTLDGAVLEGIAEGHVQAMTQAIDLQAAGDFAKADLRLRTAAEQIQRLALALAAATVRSFPSRFRSTPAATPG